MNHTIGMLMRIITTNLGREISAENFSLGIPKLGNFPHMNEDGEECSPVSSGEARTISTRGPNIKNK
jgi:hypothetical protein